MRAHLVNPSVLTLLNDIQIFSRVCVIFSLSQDFSSDMVAEDTIFRMYKNLTVFTLHLRNSLTNPFPETFAKGNQERRDRLRKLSLKNYTLFL